MRYATLHLDGSPHVAASDGDGFRVTAGGAGRSLDELLSLAPEERRRALQPGDRAPVDARLAVPVRPATIVAIGLNYLDHIRETGMERPQRPLVFAKLRSSVVGPGDAIRIDASLTQEVDWEVELAAVIGARACRVAPDAALSCVFGYTVANDVSARDIQFSDGQWVRAKSLDTFCPLGPVLVSSDEIGDPQRLGLRTRVNGRTVQASTTAEMVFGVAQLISFCSQSFTLEPGDVVLTGTPWGCGAFMKPPQFLRPGDVVEAEVDRIGTLRNHVMAA